MKQSPANFHLRIPFSTNAPNLLLSVLLCLAALWAGPSSAQLPGRAQTAGGDTELFPGLTKEKKEKIFDARGQGARVLLGVNGELITFARWTQADICLDLVPEGDTLEILGSSGVRYGVIDRKCNITLEKAVEDDFHIKPALCPKRWPFKDKKSRKPSAIFPRRMEVLCEKTGKATSNTWPPNAMGWMLLGAKDYLIVPGKDTQAPQNVLWVMRNGKGFNLVHSGPEGQGVYLQVDEDQRIFRGTEGKPGKSIPTPYYWPYSDSETNKAALPQGASVFQYQGWLEPDVRVLMKNGEKIGIVPRFSE